MATQGPVPHGLILRAAELSQAAPQAWGGFLGELRVYVDARKTECVQAPLEMLQVTQGRAQGTAKLLELFQNAAKSAAAILKAGSR